MLRVMMASAVVLVAWFFLFQVLLPWVTDRPMLGLFKSRERLRLEEDIAQANEEDDLDSLTDDLVRRQRELEDRRRRSL